MPVSSTRSQAKREYKKLLVKLVLHYFPRSMMATTQSRGNCQGCRKSTGKLLRCQACKQAWYCSIECQKEDWKTNHRKQCRDVAASNKAQATWNELRTLMASASLDQAQEGFHKASDAVKQLRSDDAYGPTVKDTSSVQAGSDLELQALETLRGKTNTSATLYSRPETRENGLPVIVTKQCSKCFFHVEDMAHVSCYQVLIRPNETDGAIEAENLQVSFNALKESTIVKFWCTGCSLTLHLSGCLEDSPRVYAMDEGAVSVRLPYVPNTVAYDDEFSSPAMSLPSDFSLGCRFCNQTLVRRDTINRILPLPSGRWDEMADYLTCYPGQAAIDFSASTDGQTGLLLYDQTALVFHRSDLLDESVDVLAVPGYGEVDSSDDQGVEDQRWDQDASAAVRGDRPWRPLVGGASLTCSCCCSVVGVVPVEKPETVRLWKHRLQTTTIGEPVPSEIASCATFCVHEMIRYAETRAIFTFVIDQVGSNICLYCRLVSWDTRTATIDETTTVERPMKLYPTAKVLYEEGTIERHSKADFSKNPVWMWSTDWCCPSDANASAMSPTSVHTKAKSTAGSASLVHIQVEQLEWKSIEQSFRESSCVYSPIVVQTTILAKTGRHWDAEGNRVSLAAITL